MPESLRVGLVGAGGIAAAHLGAMGRQNHAARVVALCDPLVERARIHADRYGVEIVYPKIEVMLEESDLDAVVITTPHDSHAGLALTALEAGKHVLVEKPMAIDLEDCRALVAAAERSGSTLMVGQCERYHPSYARLRELLDAGELGEIHAVRVDAMQSSDGLPDGHWLLDGRVAGGGVVISVAVHRLDLARFLAGEISRASATTRSTGKRFTNGAEDFAVATLEFSSGAVGELFASWQAVRLPWSEGLMVIGSEGVAHAMPATPQQMAPAVVATRAHAGAAKGMGELFRDFEPVETDASFRERTGLLTDNMFDNQLLHFAHCCRSGQEPWSSGRDNLGTMAAIFAIYRSAAACGAPATTKAG